MKSLVGVLFAGFTVVVPARQFPPGYVDPQPLLAAAARHIGEASLKCITFSGTGYGGAVGQTFEYAPNIDWPRIDALANYTRTINWETGTSQETMPNACTNQRARKPPAGPTHPPSTCPKSTEGTRWLARASAMNTAPATRRSSFPPRA